MQKNNAADSETLIIHRSVHIDEAKKMIDEILVESNDRKTGKNSREILEEARNERE